MRRWIFTFVAMITFTVSANALSYTQARTEALFLTDKMAYELGLNTIQQEMVYEINLDYLLTISGTSGYYSIYWDRRNADLRYVLTTSQYRRYCNVPYFYRPIVWDGRNIYLRIYDRYTNRSRFYYPRPATYSTFRGGKNRGASWYNPRVTRSTTNSSTWRNSGATGTNNRQYKNNNDRFGNNMNSRPATSTRPNSSSRGSVAPSSSGSGSKGQFGGTRR